MILERTKALYGARTISWYWRCDRTSQFLVEGDLSIDLCKRIDFVDHVDRKCVHYGNSCVEKGMLSQQANPRIMAYILARDVHRADVFLSPEKAKSLPDFGIRGLVRELMEGDWEFNGKIRKRRCRESVLRGALLLYDAGFFDEAKIILKQLANKAVFDKALRELVAKHFDLSEYRIGRLRTINTRTFV